PEPGREPCVEHILVLSHRAAAVRTRRHIGTAHRHAAMILAVPHGNAMSPPQLARDVPVADAFQPVDVDRFPSLGENTNASAAHTVESGSSELAHAHEPLIRETRLDNRAAAIAMPHRVLVRFDFRERAALL